MVCCNTALRGIMDKYWYICVRNHTHITNIITYMGLTRAYFFNIPHQLHHVYMLAWFALYCIYVAAWTNVDCMVYTDFIR